MKRLLLNLLLPLLLITYVSGQQQQYYSPGDFNLISGEVIRDFKIGYRTMGALHSDSSNVILAPTWYTGTSKELLSFLRGGLVYIDTLKYFVVLADAIGNGSSKKQKCSMIFI